MTTGQALGLTAEIETQLRERLRGPVLTAGQPEYESSRRIWNGMVDNSPAVVVKPAGVADVQHAVELARAADLEIAIRCGGHNAAGLASTDGGMMIHLDRMRSVRVDPSTSRVWVQGGATLEDLDAETHVHGLAVPGGTVATTGLSGLTLGGGLGHLMRKYGLTLDNLVAAEVVTADSRWVRASADEHPDLFWALRGGGGNFGVVTGFEFQAHPVHSVLAGLIIHPVQAAPAVLRDARDFIDQQEDDETGLAIMLGSGPDGSPMCVLAPTYLGDPTEGESALAPLRTMHSPILDDVSYRTHPNWQLAVTHLFPFGRQVYWRSHLLNELTDEIIDMALDSFARVTSPHSIILIQKLGGAVSRIAPADTVWEYRDAGWVIEVISIWEDPNDGRYDEHLGWVTDLHDALEPFANGAYVNYLGVGESATRIRTAYPDAKWNRLVGIKDAYDPDNVFRRNQNIPPSGS